MTTPPPHILSTSLQSPIHSPCAPAWPPMALPATHLQPPHHTTTRCTTPPHTTPNHATPRHATRTHPPTHPTTHTPHPRRPPGRPRRGRTQTPQWPGGRPATPGSGPATPRWSRKRRSGRREQQTWVVGCHAKRQSGHRINRQATLRWSRKGDLGAGAIRRGVKEACAAGRALANCDTGIAGREHGVCVPWSRDDCSPLPLRHPHNSCQRGSGALASLPLAATPPQATKAAWARQLLLAPAAAGGGWLSPPPVARSTPSRCTFSRAAPATLPCHARQPPPRPGRTLGPLALGPCGCQSAPSPAMPSARRAAAGCIGSGSASCCCSCC